MAGPATGDPLLDAASQAADGHDSTTPAAGDADQQRVMDNLARLAALKAAFSRVAGTESGVDAVATPAPARWGHLEVLGEIGRGGFGVVYRAFDPVLQREVALKLRRGEDGAAHAGGWIEEARRLARVRHPNVLAVHGADVDGGRVGLWSDLLEGVPLDAELAAGPLPRTRVLAIAAQLASALQAVHAAGLVHGDIKAANVMLEPGRAVLMDFGAGVAAGDRQRYGSPGTIAPELLDGAPAGSAGDMYSFGTLLHHMLSGALPQDGSCAASLRGNAGAPLAALVEDLLSVPPAQRPSAADTARRLGEIEALPRRRRRRISVAAVIAGLSLALLAALSGLQQAREAQGREQVERTRAEAVNRFLVDLLAAPQATREGERVRVSEVLDQAVQRLSATPPTLDAAPRADLWQAIGRSLSALRRSEDARAALQQALALRRYLHGAEDLRTLEVERLLLDEAGSMSDAALIEPFEALHARAVQAAQPGHPLPALLAASIGRRHLEGGDVDAAQRWLEPVFRARHAVRWQHPLDRTVVDIAWLYLLQRRGDMAAMETLAREVRSFVQAQAGERHASALIARHLLIAALLQQGKLAEAEQEASALSGLAAGWLEEDNPLALAALGSWASALQEQGRWAEAIPINERRHAIAVRSHGRSAPLALSAALSLANGLRDTGHAARAEPLYREVIAALPERNDMALLARGNLAELQVASGRFAEARDTADAALQSLQASLGEEHLFTAYARSVLGSALRGLGRADQALPLLEQGAAGIERYLGDVHEVALEARYQQGLALLDLGRRAEAVAILEPVARTREARFGSGHARTVATRSALARGQPH